MSRSHKHKKKYQHKRDTKAWWATFYEAGVGAKSWAEFPDVRVVPRSATKKRLRKLRRAKMKDAMRKGRELPRFKNCDNENYWREW